MRKMWFQRTLALLVSLGVFASYGCGMVGQKRPVSTVEERISFTEQVGVELYANTGDSIFVSGSIGKVEALSMSGSIASTMPGGYALPFDFSIARSDLRLSFQTDGHLYYAAPSDKSAASHGLLGNVLRSGDSVGIRVDKTSGEYEWYVDNSNYNRMRSCWSRRVREDDNITFTKTKVTVVDGSSALKEIVFDGFYNGLIHFTFRDSVGGKSVEKQFAFNVVNDKPTTIGIKGNMLEILTVDSVGMKYKWLRIPQG